MPRLRIGVVVDALGLGVRQGMRLAGRLGLSGVQIDVTRGDLAPENLGRSGRRDLLAAARSYGLTISALGAHLGQGGFSNPYQIDEIVGRMRRIIDMAAELGVDVVATHIGRAPDEGQEQTRAMMLDALADVCRHAENMDRVLATETGAEEPAALRSFIELADSPALKVNYDPGNLVMNGFDPVDGVFALKDLIVHTHAKDGVRHPDGSRQATRLGEGEVDWLAYVAALDSIGYEGFYTIELRGSDDPAGDLLRAKQFLEKF